MIGQAHGEDDLSLLREAERQINAYFAKQLSVFDLPLAPTQTGFQSRMRSAMTAIPYGETRTYGDLAQYLNGSARAVGQACGRNAVPIIVPCHRVLAAGGRIGGFSGGDGVNTKRRLLAHEAPDVFSGF